MPEKDERVSMSDGTLGSETCVRIILMPSGNVVEGTRGRSYAEILSQNKVSVSTACGGMGTCGKCAIRFVSDAPDPSASCRRLLTKTLLADGWRLGCQHHAEDGSRIELLMEDQEHLASKASFEFDVANRTLDPGIEVMDVELPVPALDAPETGEEALLRGIGQRVALSLDAIRGVTDRPRDRGRRVCVVKGRRGVLDVRPAESWRMCAGAAMDIGTTTLAVYLYDLATGRRIGSSAGYNPQRGFGADVISRVGRVREHGSAGLEELNSAVLDGLNERIDEACAQAGIEPRSIYRAIVVGNPIMMHLFAGVSPVGIDQTPYVPAFLGTRDVQAHELGVGIHPSAEVLLLPGIASYVGSDIVAGILASSLGESGSPELLVDVGTNGEIVLAVDDRLISCSTAAGPAFEGAGIRQGMNALAGAIEDVTIAAGRVECSVIGGAAAKGICGTGLIGAIDELRVAGGIDETGRFSEPGETLSRRFFGEDRDRAFRLTDEAQGIALYQRDVREFQLGKAAVRAGIETLLERFRVKPDDLERLYIAGAFGTHLQPHRALQTGLLPRIYADRVHAIGNTAGQGAAFVLLDHRLQREAEALAERTEYVELSTAADFSERFVGHMSFPGTGTKPAI